jgi:hypothetical protein
LRREISTARLRFSTAQSRTGGATVPAEAVRFLERIGVVGREAVQLLRDAAEVDAGAAERGVLRHGDLDAALRRKTRRAHPAAAGTDDEKVEIC